ncbi:hypothetical protein A1Q1_03031 [Trichosporon asahii var. asahii CBS 2479]|uniref:DNA polymerase delta subunit 3 n=1 Tax=Trichosporon asahii var. asahii (strain ATCC 90039 / CBS 2479 / JCM 2466 / KCTC 7840 / NBRC 103889/ NCYC 2677 / UAMH 7654) TaxID=1186058 RepID=J5QLS6_TRIAS|nr:hypothetical protein A1Q1_03031 [Trichosporon asahii var. asahii CBS 2479]EJT47993.1 hypothetical protein A1Q1_03031 [Trichosporon asahii var. asahii CBS 2479]
MGDANRDAERYLTASLGEGNAVTFRQVARKVGVSVNTAKESEAGSEADEEEVKAEESLENEPEDIVMEEKSEELDEKKKLFAPDQFSVHIYSLSPAPLKLLIPARKLRDSPNYANASLYGGITGEPLIATSKPLRDGAMDFSGKKTVKSEPAKTAKSEPAKAVKKEAVKEEPKPAEPQRKPASSKSRRRVIESDDEDEEPPSKPVSKSSSTATKGSAKNALEPTSSMVRAEDQAAMEAMMAMDVDFDDDDLEDTKPKPKPSTSAPSGTRKRKRRQVKKSKQEMDAKGYMVTKDYWTEESCSGSDTDTEAAPKPKPAAPASKPASKPVSRTASDSKPKPAPAKKAGSMGQSTLASFFKKK